MSLSKTPNDKFSKAPTLQDEDKDRSRLTSKNSIANALENRLAGYLTPTDQMNSPVAGVKEVLSKLPQLHPSEIPELSGLFDPTTPWHEAKVDQDTGSTYKGQVQQNCANGWGVLVSSKGDYIEGFFKNGYLNTFCRWIDRRGKFYQGGIRDGLLEGKGVLRDKYGITIDTTWVNNKASGQTRITSSDRKVLARAQAAGISLALAHNGDVIVFEGTVKDGKSEGFCYVLNPKEDFFYRGQFLNDTFHGYGEKCHFSRRVYKGQFKAGKEEGTGQLQYPDGRTFSGQFKDGMPAGSGQLTTESGEVKEVLFSNGRFQSSGATAGN